LETPTVPGTTHRNNLYYQPISVLMLVCSAFACDRSEPGSLRLLSNIATRARAIWCVVYSPWAIARLDCPVALRCILFGFVVMCKASGRASLNL
jgi:hypothetical protein